MATLGKLLKNSKTRSLLLLTVTIFIVGLTIFVARSSKTDAATDQNSRTMAVPTTIKAIPGNETPEKYRELQIIDNKNRAQEAKKSSDSAIPTIIRNNNEGSNSLFDKKNGLFGADGKGPSWLICGQTEKGPYGVDPTGKPYGMGPDGKPYTHPAGDVCKELGRDGDRALSKDGYQIHGIGPYGPYGIGPDGKPFGIGPDGNPYDPNGPFAPEWYHPPKSNPQEEALNRLKKQTPDLDKLRAERLEKLKAEREEQERLRAERARSELESQTAASNEKIMKQRMQSMEGLAQALLGKWAGVTPQVLVKGTIPTHTEEHLASLRGNSHSIDTDTTVEDPNNFIPAGTILFAVIDTSINSDEPGPVLASLVSGPYKGGRLLGSFQPPKDQNATGLTLQFDHINLPRSLRSIGMNAVGINPDTARTVLASDVDHHYLLRYGTLFASAFMTGYAQVIQSAGSSQTNNTNGSSTTTTAQLSPKKELMAGLGTVGTQWGKSMGDVANVLPTIQLNAGTSIGVLLLQDLNLTAAFSKHPPKTAATPNPTTASQTVVGTPVPTTTPVVAAHPSGAAVPAPSVNPPSMKQVVSNVSQSMPSGAAS